MIVEFFPFEHMVDDRKKGTMYAEGWRKAQVPNQIVGRYINQNKLNQQMTIKGFSQDEEVAEFMKMGNFLSTVFQEVLCGAYDSCKSYLKNNQYPH
ncbi:hypothetical protein BY996DRAFT_8067394, partial [Phakopsora pachyrhizi]